MVGYFGLLALLFACISQNYSWCNGSEFVLQRILRICYVDAMGELVRMVSGLILFSSFC